MKRINLYLNASDVNQTVTECLCTIYTTAAECDEEPQTAVYAWFFVLFAIIVVILSSIYVARSIQRLIRFVHKTRAFGQPLPHMH